ncbi:MAG: DUF5658 family protein [Woeseiaceae bacterium]|nr:DUF5658 family protein [Woeseiaceae bacterium]
MSEAASYTEQRSVDDRRQFGWRTVFYGFLRSRRRAHRREADADVVFMDWHHPWLFFLAVGTMLLSCTDAVLTLTLIDFGFYEANPFMASIMGQGTAAFAATKMALTGFGILTLVFLAKAHFLDRFRTGLFLTVFFLAYACLVCYETVNLLRFL